MDGVHCLIVFICWFVLTDVDASCHQDHVHAERSVEIRDNYAEIKLAFPNAAECHASIEIVCPSQCSNSSTKHFTCLCSKLNQMYNISATVLQDGVMSHVNYSVYTTDVQSVAAGAVNGENAPTITCNFAKGTNCTGCCLDWWPTDTPESTLHHCLNIFRSQDSLEASGTIEGLVPGKTYMLKAYDIEWDGSTSTDVGVTLKGELSIDDNNADADDSSAIAASLSVVLLTCTCAVSAAVLLVTARRFKGRISMRQILEHKKKREQRREANKKKKQNEEFDECSIPPVPPRTSDMHILVFPENTQAYLGTGSNACTVIATVEYNATSHEAISVPNNILPCKLQGTSQVCPDQSSNPEVVSVCSAGTPPPIPPRSDGMFQLPQQSLEPIPDIVRSKDNHFSWLAKLGIGRKGTHSGSTNSTVYPPPGTVDRDTFNIETKYNLAYQHTELLAM